MGQFSRRGRIDHVISLSYMSYVASRFFARQGEVFCEIVHDSMVAGSCCAGVDGDAHVSFFPGWCLISDLI